MLGGERFMLASPRSSLFLVSLVLVPEEWARVWQGRRRMRARMPRPTTR